VLDRSQRLANGSPGFDPAIPWFWVALFPMLIQIHSEPCPAAGAETHPDVGLPRLERISATLPHEQHRRGGL